VSPSIDFLNAADAVLATNVGPTVNEVAGAWVGVSHSAIAPANTTKVRLRGLVSNSVLNEVHFVDTATLVLGEPPPGLVFVDNPATGPPAYTIRLAVPFPPTSTRYQQLAELVKVLSPAHLEVEIVYQAGFVLDASALDLQAF
jgi:hypothetical protein